MIHEVETAIQFFYTLAGITVTNPLADAVVAEETQPVINVGDTVKFFDDETETWSIGVFEGFWCDLNKAGETSPYWTEHTQSIQRVLIRETMAGGTIRPNYALPDNVYALWETPQGYAN
jgi:hypothetical protein